MIDPAAANERVNGGPRGPYITWQGWIMTIRVFCVIRLLFVRLFEAAPTTRPLHNVDVIAPVLFVLC